MLRLFAKKNTKKAGADVSATPTTSTLSAPASTLFLSFSTKERVLFAKRLSFLMKAGVSVIESITIVRNQTKSKRKKRIFDTIIEDITAGQSLSRGLEK